MPQAADREPPVNPQVVSQTRPGDANPIETQGIRAVGPTDNDDQVLQELWSSRVGAGSSDGSSSNFILGPGDVLQISLPQIEQVRDRTVRVSEENTIALPLLGVINVAGMSEQELRDDLSRRVAKYFYHPQVGVFMRHTENRQVAVLGAVRVPGRYMLASHSDTVMMMISRAGGMTNEAAPRVILIPRPSVVRERLLRANQSPSQAPNSQGPSASVGGYGNAEAAALHPGGDLGQGKPGTEQVLIRISRASDQRYLNMPAEPGDVIIVPSAGEVTVQGWVDKPGAFRITPGMTAMGSIAAAGGALFSSSATLLREQSDGSKIQIPLDLSRIKSGGQSDVQVQGGDIVVVERSALGAVPYTGYFIMQHLGIGLPIPM
jgi:polysaccharide export outer membrane protein